MQELEQTFAARRPESGSQIRYAVLGEITRDRVQERVADASSAARLGGTRSCADDEIVLVESGDQPDRVRWMVLTVAVEDQHQATRRLADTRLHRGPVALVVRVTDDAGAGLSRPRPCVVRGAIVHNKDLVPRTGAAESRNERFDGRALVERRDNHRDGFHHVANRKLMMSPSSTM